jgi:phospholipid/cholesterol/gamma-HCH transport system substrate-binding protein
VKIKVDNPVETLVGAAVLALAIAFAFYASGPRTADGASEDYEVFALFRSVGSLKLGSDVRIAGVKIGRVSRLELDPDTMNAKVTMSVNRSVSLSDETIAIIDSEGLIGGVFVSLDPVPGFADLEPGDQIANTQGAVSLMGLISNFATGAASGGGS